MQKPKFKDIYCNQRSSKECPYLFDDNTDIPMCCAYQDEQKKGCSELSYIKGLFSKIIRCEQCIKEFPPKQQRQNSK